MAGQQQHIAVALAQRGYPQRIGPEPVVQVGAKAAGAHFFGQLAVGGGNDAYIHMALLIRPQALQLAVLQYPQQLGLHAERQFADLIEKQRAAIGQFELATARAGRAGEGAAHVAEQLAFHQRLGQGGAVEADQRLVPTVGLLVNRLGDQFLAYARFAADQYGKLTFGDQIDLFQ